MIAEKEVILTFLPQFLSERGVLDRFAFKGGTCLRKMVPGSQARFSTDLDFTALEEHDHETVILDMMAAFEQPFHDIQFTIPDNRYYETQDGLSWGVNPSYTHEWNGSGESAVRFQKQLEIALFALLPALGWQLPKRALPLVRIIGESPLLFGQVTTGGTLDLEGCLLDIACSSQFHRCWIRSTGPSPATLLFAARSPPRQGTHR